MNHRLRLPNLYNALSPTWQQVYERMIRVFPNAEKHGADFRTTVLMHARCFVADVLTRIALSRVFMSTGLNPSIARRVLFIKLVKWNIIPFDCRCNLCTQVDEILPRDYAPFLVHLLIDVHPRITDWVSVPSVEVNAVKFSRILEVAQEIIVIFGINQDTTDVPNLQFFCRCGHPSYPGPLTFGQLVRII